jgi:hypothetical protein
MKRHSLVGLIAALLILFSQVQTTNAQISWVCSYDFLTSNGGWTATGNGTWSSGTGWVHTDSGTRSLRIRKIFSNTAIVQQVKIYLSFTRGNTNQAYFWLPYTDFYLSNSPTNGSYALTLLPSISANSIQMEFITSDSSYSGGITIRRIEIGGSGTSFCGEPTPVPTATATTTPATGTPRPASQCMYLLPCGQVPWLLPSYPELNSPTPFSLEGLANPEQPTATPTSTALPSVPDVDLDGLQGAIGTMAVVSGGTLMPVDTGDGTPVSYEDVDASGAELFFSYVKGLDDAMFGPFTPIATWLIFWFSLMLLLALIQVILKAVGIVINFVRACIQMVLDFLPG